jgi:phosphoribosyl-ATP pyrophosphohydrolase
MASITVIPRLFATIEARKKAKPDKSYTAKLFAMGRARIAQKVGEEATEAVIAAVSGSKEALIEESADVLYHLMVLWAERGLALADIWAELEDRTSMSGIKEKKTRAKKAVKKKR